MLTRVLVQCLSCEGHFVLRLGVGPRHQRLIFQCPVCDAVLRARMDPDPDKLSFGWYCEDLVDCGYPADLDETAVVSITVYTDLPVPRKLQGRPASAGFSSPYLLLRPLLPAGDDVVEQVDALRDLRDTLVPSIRRISGHAAAGDWEKLSQGLAGLDLPVELRGHPLGVFARCVDSVLIAVGGFDMRIAAAEELVELSIATELAHPERYHETLAQLLGEPSWAQHRRRVIDTAMAALDLVDALFPALVWERLDGEHDVADYQVMRDDFDQLKGIYQDIFELASRSLVYVGAIANLRYRDDPLTYLGWGRSEPGGSQPVVQVRKTLSTALNRTSAYQREPILTELPHAARLYEAMSRNMRNSIGHRLVAYDFATQTLVDDEGRQRNYLLFLVDYLQAVRLVGYLVTVVEKLTLEHLIGRAD